MHYFPLLRSQLKYRQAPFSPAVLFMKILLHIAALVPIEKIAPPKFELTFSNLFYSRIINFSKGVF
jgi:hypothetical protein